MKERIKRIQQAVGVTADGIVGPVTLTALEDHLGLTDKAPAAAVALKAWPTQAQVRSGKSIFGRPGQEGELVSITPAYPLYFEGNHVRTIRVHKLIAEDVKQALQEVLAHYGQQRIRELGLDQYGGSYNYRATTNGSSLSMHAWGIALDFAPEGNAMSMRAPQATLSRHDCAAFWDIWERHGAVSMGRTYDKDWMHVQFATF